VSEPEDEDFATMFEASEQARRIEKGRTIEGIIVAIGEESALVDVGGKSEAEIAIAELKDDEGDLEVAVGDRIQATVVSTAGGLKLSRRLALRAASTQQLEDAFRSGLPVEGKVVGEVKGGFEVRIARQRAFCPVSQIDVVPKTDPAQHIGRVYSFRIIEYKEGGRNLVVSRRALLEEQQKAAAADVRNSIVEGAVVTGRVASVRDFGAFVDLGGGVRVDADKQKISLGLKQLLDDPWSKAGDTFQPGQLRSGRVARVADFGVFVELEPGVEGLLPSSETNVGRDGDLKKAFPLGSDVQVVVQDVDATARRIRLSITAVQKLREADEVREYTERGDEKPAGAFGSMADKLRDALRKGS
jgi:small subunit ribosomal protein S1